MLSILLCCVVAQVGADREAGGTDLTNAEAVCGTWVLQQVGSRQELERLVPRTLGPALETPQVRGFCLRAPWLAVDQDFSLLQAGKDLADRHGVAYSVRFMAGRHTPRRLFDSGCRYYEVREKGSGVLEKVPAPFLVDGSPNVLFETQYDRFVARLAQWCRTNDVRLLHLAWYGQAWAELNHGKEVRALPGYSYENWLKAHIRLLDIGLAHSGADLAVEFPFSGYGPLTDAAVRFADHVVEQLGPNNPRFFCQANGWGPRGDWGAPTAETEAAFDRVWLRAVCRGQQSIQPQDYRWKELYEKLVENRSTYCEVYAPSFTLGHKDELAREIRRFAERCRSEGPALPLQKVITSQPSS